MGLEPLSNPQASVHPCRGRRGPTGRALVVGWSSQESPFSVVSRFALQLRFSQPNVLGITRRGQNAPSPACPNGVVAVVGWSALFGPQLARLGPAHPGACPRCSRPHRRRASESRSWPRRGSSSSENRTSRILSSALSANVPIPDLQNTCLLLFESVRGFAAARVPETRSCVREVRRSLLHFPPNAMPLRRGPPLGVAWNGWFGRPTRDASRLARAPLAPALWEPRRRRYAVSGFPRRSYAVITNTLVMRS
jgi:hypothetical protein